MHPLKIIFPKIHPQRKVVFVELLTGEAAFHRDAGQCDGYTEEVVLREIKEVTDESIERILEQVKPRQRDGYQVYQLPGNGDICKCMYVCMYAFVHIYIYTHPEFFWY